MLWDDIEKSRREAQRQGMAARMSADDGVVPEVGQVYTVSPCFRSGDRSWIDDFWEVLETSGPNLLIKIHEGRGRSMVRLFRADDRAWYPAGKAFDIFRSHSSE